MAKSGRREYNNKRIRNNFESNPAITDNPEMIGIVSSTGVNMSPYFATPEKVSAATLETQIRQISFKPAH
jgi:hypothetical protein